MGYRKIVIKDNIRDVVIIQIWANHPADRQDRICTDEQPEVYTGWV